MALVGHILLGDDWQGKKQLLAALLGHWSPPLWRGMAQAAIEHAGAVGHCRDFQQTADAVRDQGDRTALPHSDAAVQALAAARRQFARERFVASFASADCARQELVAAYLRAQPSLPRGPGRLEPLGHRRPFRATGIARPGCWPRGFNMILPNMLWGGLAHYPSEVLPPSATSFATMAIRSSSARPRRRTRPGSPRMEGLFQSCRAPQDFVERSAQPASHAGFRARPRRWIGYVRRIPTTSGWNWTLLEVARKYRVAGLHLRLHSLSGRGVLLLRGLPAAVRGGQRSPRDALAGGPFPRRRGRRNTTTGAVGRSRNWSRPCIVR